MIVEWIMGWFDYCGGACVIGYCYSLHCLIFSNQLWNIRHTLCKLLKFTAILKFHSGFSSKKTNEKENWNRWTEFQLNFRYIVSKRSMWSGGLNRVFYSLVLCNRLIRLAKGNVISFLKSFIILMTLFDAFSVVFCVALSLCVCCISCMHIGRHKTNFLNENEYF